MNMYGPCLVASQKKYPGGWQERWLGGLIYVTAKANFFWGGGDLSLGQSTLLIIKFMKWMCKAALNISFVFSLRTVNTLLDKANNFMEM